MPQTRTVKCPQCNAEVVWHAQSVHRPFCSERCKQMDLGAWASEQYRVPTTAAEEGGTDDLPGSTPEPN